MTVAELKKQLVASGFEIYRTFPSSVALAERVRENLILDSGIRVALGSSGYTVRVVFRAEGRGFPGDSEEQTLERARTLANQCTGAGFVVVDQSIAPQMDPSHPDTELDRFYEVACERHVADIAEAKLAVTAAFQWLRSVPAS